MTKVQYKGSLQILEKKHLIGKVNTENKGELTEY